MRSDEIEDRVRKSAFIGDALAFPDYEFADIMNECNDRLRSVFSDQIISARCGYWLHRDVVTVTNGYTRFPSRAVVGGLEGVDFLLNGQYWHLREITPREANDWSVQPSPANGLPVGYWCDSEKINIVPTPSGSVTVRLRYYLRPSLLVQQQSAATGVGAVRGQVTAVDPTNRVATVNVLPNDYSATGSFSAIVSGAVVDVVRPSGWHMATAINLTTAITGLNITLAALSSADFTEAVQIGDYIRVRDTTDWPALPADFHRLLADAAACNILRELNLDQKASVLSTAASADFQRFTKLISPRVKSEPMKIRHRPYWMRSRW